MRTKQNSDTFSLYQIQSKTRFRFHFRLPQRLQKHPSILLPAISTYFEMKPRNPLVGVEVALNLHGSQVFYIMHQMPCLVLHYFGYFLGNGADQDKKSLHTIVYEI